MKPTERDAKSPFTPTTGLFATLGGLFRAIGTGAPSVPRARFALAPLLAVLAVCLAPASALASTGHQWEGSFGPDGTNASHFVIPGAVAVDQGSHDVYVADRPGFGLGTVSRFDEGGAPVEFIAGPGSGTNEISGLSFNPGEPGTSQIAVNSTTHDFYVADLGSGGVEAFHADGEEAEFTAGPGSGSNKLPAFSEVCGVAVDASGAIYMGDYGTGVHVFAPSGEELTAFAVSEPCNVAVDSHGAVYVARSVFGSGTVEKFTPSAFPVSAATEYPLPGAAVDPGPAFALAIDPASDDLYVVEHPGLEESNIVQYSDNGEFIGEFGSTGPGALKLSEGVAIDGATEKVFASDAAGERQVEIFAPPPAVPPSVEATTASNVTATSADLKAQVNPNSFETKYHFDYLTEAEYQLHGEAFFPGAPRTPETVLGSSGAAQTASAHLAGLAPETTYRFQVVAENKNGKAPTSAEPSRVVTFASLSLGLPDGRAYEMVSPPKKAGEVFTPTQSDATCGECLPGENDQMMPMQSAPDGEAVAYQGQPFSAGLAAGPNEYLSRRSPTGWGAAQSLSSPDFANGRGSGEGFKAFSADLSRGVIFQVRPALSPEAPVQDGSGESYPNLYLRDERGSLRPLVTRAPEHRDPGSFKIVYAGASSAPAFGHVVFEANEALPTINTPAAVDGGIVEKEGLPANLNLYEWFAGQLHLINLAPGNAATAPGAVVGSGHLLAPHPTLESANVAHAISTDGSRIFWSDEGTGRLYVRVVGEKTLEIPGPGRCKESLPLAERVCFLTASADGSEVLLSDGQSYKLNVEAEAYEPTTDLTEGQGGFQGLLGASEDLSRVYFIDNAALTGGQENANHEHAEAGKFNLYASHEGVTAFIGVLLGEDNEVGGGEFGDWHATGSNRTAQVSADGGYLAFTSRAHLSEYDNAQIGGTSCDSVNVKPQQGQPCFEVFEYEAATARLVCASCNPSAQRPLGASRVSLIRTVPGLPPVPQPGNLPETGQGRLFFESQDALSPQDTNGHVQDVYEWEPNGIGSCKRASGCVSLISGGSTNNDSFFLDSTPSGNDAFIVTRERLLPRDKNEQLDLYDARASHVVGESVGFPESGISSSCGGEACKGPLSSAPPSQAPGSAVFSGPGNFAFSLTSKPTVTPPPLTRAQKLAKALKACSKKPHKKRRACRVQAKKRYGPIKAKAKSRSHKGGK